MGEVTPATRRLVLARDEYSCTAAALPGQCWGHLDMGHIIGRGSGGGDRYDSPGWLLTQCRYHNGQIEDDAATRRAAHALGMHLDRNSVALIPQRPLVTYPDGNLYYLNDDGTKEREDVPWKQNQPG